MSCPIVHTRNGKVKGSVSILQNNSAKKIAYTYRNIPFAQPPTGTLRFLPPKPAKPWTGIRDGTVHGNVPIQPLIAQEMMAKTFPFKTQNTDELTVDEDCLNLTVYTPSVTEDKKLPVMVWFYGGGLQTGSGAFYDGSALAGMNDVVVVMPNYRVGFFGFFCFGKSKICSGNAGLFDQRMALEWVRDNIAAFGGDKDNVTIFGQSAGASCVDFHVLSPKSHGLFHKAISQSGQACIPDCFMTEEKLKKSCTALVEYLKIDKKEEQEILAELQKLPVLELNQALEALAIKEVYFYANLDDKFFEKHPDQCLADKDFAKVPYLIGCNNTEGYGLFGAMGGADFETGFTEEQAKKTFFIRWNEELFSAWKKFYIKDENDEKRFSRLFGNVMGDSMFVVPAVRTASAHAAAGCDVFMYYGCFQIRLNHDDAYGKEITKKVDWCKCDHGDEMHMVLGMPFSPGNSKYEAKYSEEEIVLSRKVMSYFANFAKTGNPNQGSAVDVVWPKFGVNGEFLVLDHDLSTSENLEPEIVEFWSKEIPELKRKFPATN